MTNGWVTWCAMSAALLFSNAAYAQANIPVPPTHRVVDQNGFDYANGGVSVEVTPLKIGAGELSVSVDKSLLGNQIRDTFQGTLSTEYDPIPNGTTSVSIGIRSSRFRWVGSTYTPVMADGSSLTFNASTNTYTFTANDGSVGIFDHINTQPLSKPNGRLRKLTYPNGHELNFHYVGGPDNTYRIQNVTSSLGYIFKYIYSQDEYYFGEPGDIWLNYHFYNASGIKAINGTHAYCDPTIIACTATGATSTFYNGFGNTELAVSSPAGDMVTMVRDTVPPYNWLVVTSVFRSGANPGAVTYSHDIYGRIISASSADGSWTYAYADTSTTRTITRTDAQSRQVIYGMTASVIGWVLGSYTDENNRTTTYSYDAYGKLTRVTHPEGNHVNLTYDGRGNVTEKREVAKSGSGIADIVTTATFPSTCTDTKTCNKPTSVTDARGNVTDYTYDPAHGGVLTETMPAPTPGAPRPQKRYSYAQRYAWMKNSGGTLVQAATPVWVRTQEAFCRTSAAVGNGCAVSGDEVVTTFDYGSPSTPSNLLLRGQVVTADGVSLRTCYGYDREGNRISETKPRALLTSCPQ